MKFNFVVVPYRDLYFQNKYGWAVRDLMIIKTLEKFDEVESIFVVNRPVSLYERLLTKPRKKFVSSSKIYPIDVTSFDLVGPLQKRLWTKNCYNLIFNKKFFDYIEDKIGENKSNSVNVFLDFTPIADIPYEKLKYRNFIIWYDVIDNFTKHNRYSLLEKQAVSNKYDKVDKMADLITGVTNKALEMFPNNTTKYAMHNGILEMSDDKDFKNSSFVQGKPEFLFGFIGFITDKFDIGFVLQLSEFGKVVIYGDFYDKKVKKHLLKQKNIVLKGRFNSKNLGKIINSFKIGIIPYKLDKSHDGSPLKLYQYLYYGKPSISSIGFEDEIVNCEYVLISKEKERISAFLKKVENINMKDVKKCFDNKYLWSFKLKKILKAIERKYDENCHTRNKGDT